MERQIKFRVWDKWDHRMIKRSSDLHLGMSGDLYLYQDGELFKTTRFIVLPYTGLNDKLGNQIFKGDILKHDNGAMGVVVCRRGGYSVEEERQNAATNDRTKCYSVLDDDRWKIIGNIYDNPELLENYNL